MYLLTNDKESKLGTTPLPDGVVRVFRRNGRDGLSYLVGQPIKYVPIGDKIELNLGRDPDVIFELIKLRVWRDEIWMNTAFRYYQFHGPDVFKKVGEPGVKIEVHSSVVGWDDHTLYSQRVRNYTKKPIDLEVRRAFPGHVVFRSRLAAKNFDYQTVEYTATVKPGEKADLLYEVVQHQGRNAKQNSVTVEKAAYLAFNVEAVESWGFNTVLIDEPWAIVLHLSPAALEKDHAEFAIGSRENGCSAEIYRGPNGGLKSQSQLPGGVFSKKTSVGVRKSRHARGRLLSSFSTSRTS
jgi:hypothetical protein